MEVMALRHDYFRKQLDLTNEVERLVSFVQSAPSVKCLSVCQEVSPVVQKGPMCGLVALTMAAQLLLKDEGGPSVKACPTRTDKHHPESILEYARHCHLTKQGEVFSCETLADIVTDHLHMQAQVFTMDAHGVALRNLLARLISGQGAVLVPYDADKNHTPCLSKGHRAHWCLLVGLYLASEEGSPSPLTPKLLQYCHPAPNNPVHYTLKEGHEKEFSEILTESLDTQSMQDILKDDWIHVFARQGKSAHLCLWSLKDLVESNGNLVEIDPQRSNPLEYVIPQGGVRRGLQNKVVFITKSFNS